LKLNQKALLADEHVQGVELFPTVQLVRLEVRLAERGHAQVNEGAAQGFLAEAAGCG
jgi:hypothetical protein